MVKYDVYSLRTLSADPGDLLFESKPEQPACLVFGLLDLMSQDVTAPQEEGAVLSLKIT